MLPNWHLLGYVLNSPNTIFFFLLKTVSLGWQHLGRSEWEMMMYLAAFLVEHWQVLFSKEKNQNISIHMLTVLRNFVVISFKLF